MSAPYIGIQLRTGDAYMGVGDHKPVSNVSMVLHKIADHVKTTSYKHIYFTSDHPHAKNELQNLLPSHTIIDVPQSRVHFERTRSASPSQLISIIFDILTLTQANYLIISEYSNYGRLAALIKGDASNVVGFSPPNFNISKLSLSALFTKEPHRILVRANPKLTSVVQLRAKMHHIGHINRPARTNNLKHKPIRTNYRVRKPTTRSRSRTRTNSRSRPTFRLRSRFMLRKK